MSGKTAADWIRPEIQALSAYHVNEHAGLIKLDAMENPYSWSEDLVDQWLELLRRVELNRYPDPEAEVVRHALRDSMAVPDAASMVLGNGSDELIQMILLSLTGEGRCVLTPQPGFVMYRLSATVTGLEYVGVPLRNDDFQLDMPAMRAAIAQHNPAVIFIACPNNPTGNGFSRSDILELIDLAPGLIVLDEAYAPFTEQTFIADVVDFDNLLVMRTVSKMGLAGLRLGLLVGNAQWIDEINKTRLPYNINVLTQASSLFALQHSELFDQQAAQIRADRKKLVVELMAHQRLQVFPSEANFILLRTPVGRADEIFDRVKDLGVLIKNLHGSDPALADCLRVTVGSAAENKAFLNALATAL